MIRVDLEKFKLDSPDHFWEQNPQFRFLDPYSELYENDNSDNHSYSSKAMWVIVFMLSPDEDDNLFYRRSEEARKEALIKFHPDLNWEEKTFLECYNSFPQDCLSTVEREIKKAERTIQDRVDLINDTEWTLDETQVRVNQKTGKNETVLIKGTAGQLDTLQRNLPKAIEVLEQLKQRYAKEKAERKGRGKLHIHEGQTSKFWQS